MPETPPQTDTYNTALDIFDRTHPLRVDIDENLKIVGTVTAVPSGVQDVAIVGTVTIQQPIEITQPVNVILPSSGITIGTVNQGLAGTQPWPVTGTFSFSPSPSTTATVTAIVVTTSPTVLLSLNLLRKGFAIQNTSGIIFVKLDTTVSTALYSYELPKKGILEIENYCGPVSAVTTSGTVTVMVTEKV
jgi:hypothetical protein